MAFFQAFPANNEVYYLGATLPQNLVVFHSINEFKSFSTFFSSDFIIPDFVIPASTILLCCLVTVFRNPIHGLLALIYLFLLSASLLFIQNLQFLGLAFLIIYVGAIAILFLFVLMLFNLQSLVTYQPIYKPSEIVLFSLTVFAAAKMYIYFATLLFYKLYIQRVLRAHEPVIPLLERGIFQPENDMLEIALALYNVENTLFFNLLVDILLLAMLGALILALMTKRIKARKRL